MPLFARQAAVSQVTPPYAWRCGCANCQVAWGLLVAAEKRQCNYHPSHTPMLIHWETGQQVDVTVAQQWLNEHGLNYTVC